VGNQSEPIIMGAVIALLMRPGLADWMKTGGYPTQRALLHRCIGQKRCHLVILLGFRLTRSSLAFEPCRYAQSPGKIHEAHSFNIHQHFLVRISIQS
jgi:hypothetical protein